MAEARLRDARPPSPYKEGRCEARRPRREGEVPLCERPLHRIAHPTFSEADQRDPSDSILADARRQRDPCAMHRTPQAAVRYAIALLSFGVCNALFWLIGVFICNSSDRSHRDRCACRLSNDLDGEKCSWCNYFFTQELRYESLHALYCLLVFSGWDAPRRSNVPDRRGAFGRLLWKTRHCEALERTA